MARAVKRKIRTIDMKTAYSPKSKTPIKLLFACIVFILSFFMMSACCFESAIHPDTSQHIDSSEANSKYAYGDYLKPIDGLEPLTKYMT